MSKTEGLEFKFNVGVWIVTVGYSLYRLFLFTNGIETLPRDYEEDFEAGWLWLGRSKDVSDYEWRTWKRFSLYLFPWLCVNTLFVQLAKLLNILSPSKCHTIIAFALITCKFGFSGLLILITQPLIYYFIVVYYSNAAIIWMISCFFMSCINIIKRIYETTDNFHNININTDDVYIIMITVSWINLRCISYSLEMIKSNNEGKKHNSKEYKTNVDLYKMLGYIFYAPLLFLGPVILYNDFEESLKAKNNIPFGRKLICFITNTSRYFAWFFFTEFCLHFIYFNAFVFHAEIVKSMPTWSLYGGGLWMGLYFYLKYLVVYGLTGSWAALDGVEPPTPPRCVARVHRYSQMWKYFDVGLHKFLLRYVYQPVVNGVSKDNIVYLSIMRSMGSLLCFLFVYCWHGAHDFILIWTVLNYIGIVIESLSKTLAQSGKYKNFKRSFLKTQATVERFEASLATPILIMSALSNFYFFAGYDIGEIYLHRLRTQSTLAAVVLFVCLYCSCRAAQCLDKIQATKIKIY